MISILASGTLIKQPEARVSRNGNSFVTALVPAGATDETFLVSIAAFDEQVCKALLALNKGDDVSIIRSTHRSAGASRADHAVCPGDWFTKG